MFQKAPLATVMLVTPAIGGVAATPFENEPRRDAFFNLISNDAASFAPSLWVKLPFPSLATLKSI